MPVKKLKLTVTFNRSCSIRDYYEHLVRIGKNSKYDGNILSTTTTRRYELIDLLQVSNQP